MANLRTRVTFSDQFADVFMQRAKGPILAEFRRAVWAVFEELVYTTPQYSGRAAANWNIGVGAPDFSVDYGLGEQEDVVPAKKGGHKIVQVVARHTGDEKWAVEALERNRHKLLQIKGMGQNIYISNATRGDADTTDKTGGMAGADNPYYLAALQSPSYWHKRLRDENKPYETVSQVLLSESWRGRLTDKLAGKRYFE